jgi:hypothetical protein
LVKTTEQKHRNGKRTSFPSPKEKMLYRLTFLPSITILLGSFSQGTAGGSLSEGQPNVLSEGEVSNDEVTTRTSAPGRTEHGGELSPFAITLSRAKARSDCSYGNPRQCLG